MANLYTGEIKADDYVNLATETGQSLSSGSKYLIQSHDNDFFFRVGTTGKGEYVKALEHVYYTAGADDLYVRPASWGYFTVNISSEG